MDGSGDCWAEWSDSDRQEWMSTQNLQVGGEDIKGWGNLSASWLVLFL